MKREDYLAQIKSLSDTLSQFKDMISYLKSVHESDVAEKSKLQELIVSLTDEVNSLRKELAKQNNCNNRHNKQALEKTSGESDEVTKEPSSF